MEQEKENQMFFWLVEFLDFKKYMYFFEENGD